MASIQIPLLHDHHSHGSLYAALQGCPDLRELSRDEALRLLEALPVGRLSLVTGHRSAVLELTQEELDRLPPALIVDFSLHGFLCTAAALPLLEARFPEIAAHKDDAAWKERYVPRLFSLYVTFAGLDEAKLEAFFESLEAVGTGSTEDMSVSAEALKAIAATPYRDRFVFWISPEEEARLAPEEKALVRGVKLYLDGSIGARTAAIAGRYLGGGEGILTYSDSALVDELSRYGKIYDLALHAIGERAIEQALGALRFLTRHGGRCCRRVRLEHAQFITERQARLAKDLGIVLSMQPNFTGDSVVYADRLDEGLRRANNPFRMLMDSVGFVPGRDLLFGSDGMPHGHAAAFKWSLFPPYPGQKLSVAELVAGFGKARGAKGECIVKIDDEASEVETLSA